MVGSRVTTQRWGHVGLVVDEAPTLAALAGRHLAGITWDTWLSLQEPSLDQGEADYPWLVVETDGGDRVMVPRWDIASVEKKSLGAV